ncbi:MAG: urease accessory protein UreE [Burkholderiaceae bacterium]
MLIFRTMVESHAADDQAINRVSLPFDARQRSRLRISIEHGPLAGEAAGIDLPRGSMMRGGSLLTDDQGRWLRVEAAAEALLAVHAGQGASLAALAYHLGNRHVPVEITPDTLYLTDDHVLAQMVTGLGAEIARVRRPFEPEGGAYGGGHQHGAHEHGHDHGHSHSHGQDHAHTHHGGQHEHEPRGRRPGPGAIHAPRIHDLSSGGAIS